MIRQISFVVGLGLASACSPVKPGTGPSANHPSGGASKTERLSAELRRDQARFAAPLAVADDSRDFDALSYSLTGEFDWQGEALKARVTAVVHLTHPETEHLTLDSRVTEVRSVLLNGTVQPGYVVDKDAGALTIDLAGLSAEVRAQDLTIAVDYVRLANETPDAGAPFDPIALRAISPRAGDPVTARTVNTMSEPRSASQWMPCKDDPADRARFSAELIMPADEALISNGKLVRDERLPDGRRVMGYSTSFSLPTYLMAFAEGQLISSVSEVGNLPIGVWSRRGLAVDTDGVISQLSRLITRYQELLGPYAFDQYMIVLLPEFGGGEEHAGITFQSEGEGSDTSGAGDREMIGHELAHQWFGDYMTVATWNDLWIKEGMATVMEGESTRPWEDQNAKGGLFGASFDVAAGDSIIDRDLPDDLKYTSGPYGRAAWLLAQIRAVTGDEAFFATLRQVLVAHAFGNIGTDEFLAAFQPLVGDDFLARAHVALAAKKVPVLTSEASGDNVTLTLIDEDQGMLLPFSINQIDAVGNVQTFALAAGQSVVLDRATKLTSFDPRDLHFPGLKNSFVKAADATGLKAVLDPELLVKLSGSEQYQALTTTEQWSITPTEFTALVPRLSSEQAKAQAIAKACKDAAASADPATWHLALDQALLKLPKLGLTSWYSTISLDNCLTTASPGFFDDSLRRLAADPESARHRDVDLEILSSLDLPSDQALQTWGPVAFAAPSVRERAAASQALLRTLKRDRAAVGAPAAPDAAWLAVFRDLLSGNRTNEVLKSALKAPPLTRDQGSLPALASVVKDVPFAQTEKQAVCAARLVTDTDAGSFEAFAAPLRSLNLPESVEAALASADGCPAGN